MLRGMMNWKRLKQGDTNVDEDKFTLGRVFGEEDRTIPNKDPTKNILRKRGYSEA